MNETLTYTDASNRQLWVLAGARNCRQYHLTADTRASQFVNDCTNGTGIEFLSVCGKQVSETLVQTGTNSPVSVCKKCASRASA